MGIIVEPEDFGKAFIPKAIRPNLRAYMLKAGITEVPYKAFGIVFYLTLFVTFLIYGLKVYPAYIVGLNPFSIFGAARIFTYSAATFIFFPLLFATVFALALYFYLDMGIYNRTKKMEDVLPDFLRFVSENLKGGMSFEKALWSSIKPEFDVLASEVRLSAKKVLTGQDVEEALHEFTEKYDSPILKRAFDLIIEGMKGGGKIADLIDRIIEDIEETKELKTEMKTTNLSYVIFITFVVIVVTPALFTLSYQFLIVLQGMSKMLGNMPAQTNMPISFKINMDPNMFRQFSMWALTIISAFASVIVSIINKGSIKGGIKYLPIYAVCSIIAYNIFMILLSGFFKSLFVT